MDKGSIQILVVESTEAHAGLLRTALESGPCPLQLILAQSLGAARTHLHNAPPDLMIIDMCQPAGKGLEFLTELSEEMPCPVLALVDQGDVATAVAALKAGALDAVVRSREGLSGLPAALDGMLAHWAQLGERRAAERALRENEARLSSFFESAVIGMAIISPEGRVLKMNPAFRQMSGYSEAEILGMAVLEVTHPDDRQETARLYAEIRGGHREIADYEKRYLCKDGSVPWGRTTVAGVFGSDGELKCFAANVLDITERKVSEESLRLSEQRFRTIFDNAAAGMVTLSPEGGFWEVNQAFCDFIGYSRAELLRLHLSAITHFDDLERTAENYRLLGGGQSHAIDYQKRFLHKDGRVVWGLVSVVAMPGKDGLPLYYSGLVQDVTESRFAQERVKESRQMLQLVLDYIPQQVFWKDRNSVYLGCSRNFARIAGCENPEDLIGKTDYDLPWKKEQADFYRECDRRIMESNTPEFHITESQLQASGKQVWLDTNKIPMHDSQGLVTSILVTLEDITARKYAEEKLVAANRELDAFVSTVSHDLRIPLTPIIGYAEVLQQTCRGRLDERSVGCLAQIEEQGRSMLALLDDLLTLAKVGYVQRPAVPIDLDLALEEVLVMLGSQIEHTGVVIETSPLPQARVPQTLLAQIFNNLIANAIRYAGQQGSPIGVGGERNGDLVRLYVCDSGPGIQADERRQIFEVFYRGESARRLPGTGVGLATVQKIAKLYNGRAWAEETPGGGSTFWVEFEDSRPPAS